MLDNIIIGVAVVAFIAWVLSHFLEDERVALDREKE
jgi:hypothetical protein